MYVELLEEKTNIWDGYYLWTNILQNKKLPNYDEKVALLQKEFSVFPSACTHNMMYEILTFKRCLITQKTEPNNEP